MAHVIFLFDGTVPKKYFLAFFEIITLPRRLLDISFPTLLSPMKFEKHRYTCIHLCTVVPVMAKIFSLFASPGTNFALLGAICPMLGVHILETGGIVRWKEPESQGHHVESHSPVRARDKPL